MKQSSLESSGVRCGQPSYLVLKQVVEYLPLCMSSTMAKRGGTSECTALEPSLSPLLTEYAIRMLPGGFEALLEKLFELQETGTVQSTHDLNVFL